jgi:hypothetical protein
MTFCGLGIGLDRLMNTLPLEPPPSRRQNPDTPSPPEYGERPLNPDLGALVARLADALPSIAHSLQRIADKVDPPPAAIVGSRYVAGRLGQTTTWVAEMARNGTIPKGFLVPGTGKGKLWKFYRARIDEWLAAR